MDNTDRTLSGAPESPLAPRTADALLWSALPHLYLNIAQTADLCGISVRQLGYWTKQGYVAASGQGARRMYGLDSLRRVLAIRSAMAGGASLRQALKALPEAAQMAAPLALPPRQHGTDAEDAPETRPPSSPRSAHEQDTLTADLVRLFAANPHTRDDAFGLAVKVGRATGDIRDTAEILCSRGLLSRTIAQGSVVFESAQGSRT